MKDDFGIVNDKSLSYKVVVAFYFYVEHRFYPSALNRFYTNEAHHFTGMCLEGMSFSGRSIMAILAYTHPVNPSFRSCRDSVKPSRELKAVCDKYPVFVKWMLISNFNYRTAGYST